MTPGEQAEQRGRRRDLADADYHWDGAYTFSWQPGYPGHDGQFLAVRADSGKVIPAATMERLRDLVREDYSAAPVKRPDNYTWPS